MSKPKVGFYWCASCGGCEETVVDLAEDVLGVVAAVDIVFWPCAMDFKREDVVAMKDGEMAVCFINGAIRSSEQLEMVELLRKKSQLIVAFGSCAHTGGVPSLANLYSLHSIMENSYQESPSTVNPGKVRPQTATKMPEGEVTLPSLDETVKCLDQVIPVDYYVPGCAPPTALLKGAVEAVLSGKLPPKGTILAPNIALCDECPRIDSKPDKLLVSELKRPHQVEIDMTKCLLAQGLMCLGPSTRSGCGAPCVKGNMPCTGCMGAVDQVRDFGGAAMSALASSVAATEEKEIDKVFEGLPDPAGLFYRYGVGASLLFRNHAVSDSKKGA